MGPKVSEAGRAGNRKILSFQAASIKTKRVFSNKTSLKLLLLFLLMAIPAYAFPPTTTFPKAKKPLPYVLGKKEPYRAKKGGRAVSRCEAIRKDCVKIENQAAQANDKMIKARTVEKRNQEHRRMERFRKRVNGCYQRHRRCQGMAIE